MFYCERCQVLSRDGKTCPLCGSRKLRPVCPDDPVLLLTVGEDEATRITAAFKESSVPCLARSTGSGGYTSIILGRSRCSDVRIFVPFNKIERAKEILIGIGALKTGKESEEKTGPSKQGGKVPMSRCKRIAVKIISAILFFLLIWGVVILSDWVAAKFKGLFY